MIAAILGALAPIFGQVAKSIFPDPADKLKQFELQQQLQMAVMEKAADIEKSAADIVKAEAQSSHWLAANWRPLTALTFVGLVVAHWFGYTAPGLSEPERLALLDIIQVMIGGYVIGRSVEKAAPSMAGILKK